MPQPANPLSLPWEPSQNQSRVSRGNAEAGGLGVDPHSTVPCWFLWSWTAVSLVPLWPNFNCWSLWFFLWCEGNVLAAVTSLLPRIFYIWGYFRLWVCSIPGRYPTHQLLTCAFPRQLCKSLCSTQELQVAGSVDQKHFQRAPWESVVSQGEKPSCCW